MKKIALMLIYSSMFVVCTALAESKDVQYGDQGFRMTFDLLPGVYRDITNSGSQSIIGECRIYLTTTDLTSSILLTMVAGSGMWNGEVATPDSSKSLQLQNLQTFILTIDAAAVVRITNEGVTPTTLMCIGHYVP